MSDNVPSQFTYLPEELWLTNGQLNLIMWLKVLQFVIGAECDRELSDEDHLNLEINVKNMERFGCYHYTEDLGPLAMMMVLHKQMTTEQVYCPRQ